MTTVAITGNTYPVKDQIKALGGRWNTDRKAWMVPADQADAARKLVQSAPRSTYAPARSAYSRGYGARRSSGWTGCSCGSIAGRPRDSDCRQCQYDNE